MSIGRVGRTAFLRSFLLRKVGGLEGVVALGEFVYSLLPHQVRSRTEEWVGRWLRAGSDVRERDEAAARVQRIRAVAPFEKRRAIRKTAGGRALRKAAAAGPDLDDILHDIADIEEDVLREDHVDALRDNDVEQDVESTDIDDLLMTGVVDRLAKIELDPLFMRVVPVGGTTRPGMNTVAVATRKGPEEDHPVLGSSSSSSRATTELHDNGSDLLVTTLAEDLHRWTDVRSNLRRWSEEADKKRAPRAARWSPKAKVCRDGVIGLFPNISKQIGKRQAISKNCQSSHVSCLHTFTQERFTQETVYLLSVSHRV